MKMFLILQTILLEIIYNSAIKTIITTVKLQQKILEFKWIGCGFQSI